MRSTQTEIKEAAQVIQSGGLVAMPTETVYGLGANALDPAAVAKIFQSKERPSFDPLIVHICDLKMMQSLVKLEQESPFNEVGEVDESGEATETSELKHKVEALAKAFWPGPLTMILPKTDKVPEIVSSGLPTVGIRMPNHPVALELIQQANLPIAAPSANKFGRTSPTQAEHVKKGLDEVDIVLDGGDSEVGIESTIVALTHSGFEILRPGAITPLMIIEAMNSAGISLSEEHNSHEHKVEAPGMLDSHYSPTKPLYLVDQNDLHERVQSLKDTPLDKIGFINFDLEEILPFGKLITLENLGDLTEYAVKIFAAIHQFEEEGIDVILAQKVPEQGIGVAIMDRLKKAAFQYL